MRYLILLLNLCLTVVAANAAMPTGDEFTNSIGMKFVGIEPGSFMMGLENEVLGEGAGVGYFPGRYKGGQPAMPFSSGNAF